MKSEGPRSLELRLRPQQAPRSRALVVHIHGGGFVAQTSKSHEPYLKSWAQELGVPILSIDYSLAPEAPFPRALEECFYAYCWAVKHCALLGEPPPSLPQPPGTAGAKSQEALEPQFRRPASQPTSRHPPLPPAHPTVPPPAALPLSPPGSHLPLTHFLFLLPPTLALTLRPPLPPDLWPFLPSSCFFPHCCPLLAATHPGSSPLFQLLRLPTPHTAREEQSRVRPCRGLRAQDSQPEPWLPSSRLAAPPS